MKFKIYKYYIPTNFTKTARYVSLFIVVGISLIAPDSLLGNSIILEFITKMSKLIPMVEGIGHNSNIYTASLICVVGQTVGIALGILTLIDGFVQYDVVKKNFDRAENKLMIFPVAIILIFLLYEYVLNNNFNSDSIFTNFISTKLWLGLLCWAFGLLWHAFAAIILTIVVALRNYLSDYRRNNG